MSDDRALDDREVAADPLAVARAWLDDAVARDLPEPTAMTLATVSADGTPRARMVLCKRIDADGVLFSTNYESDKSVELAHTPAAALVLWWHALQRQVRIEGRVARAADAESDAIYDARPRGSRLAAWASPQSRPLTDRAELERRMREVEARFGENDPPRPPFWGAFRLRPRRIEFWQGRPFRLHERIRVERDADGGWRARRLAP